MDLQSLTEAMKKFSEMDYSTFLNPEPLYSKLEIPNLETIAIDPEDTIMGDIKRQIVAQNKLVEQQIGILVEQNKLLTANYDKLKELYDSQVKANEGTKNDLERSRKYNRWMMIIAIVAMLAAIAGPIATLMVALKP